MDYEIGITVGFFNRVGGSLLNGMTSMVTIDPFLQLGQMQTWDMPKNRMFTLKEIVQLP